MSKLIYSASVLTMSRRTEERINRIIFNFIWDGKPAKIKKTIIAERKNGGLKMIDFEVMENLKYLGLEDLQKTTTSRGKYIIPEHTLSQRGGISFFTQCQYDMNFFTYEIYLNSTKPFLTTGKISSSLTVIMIKQHRTK